MADPGRPRSTRRPRPARPRRTRRTIAVAATVLAVGAVALAAAAWLAVGWIFSGRILTPAPYALMPEFRVAAVDGAGDALRVTLPLPSAADPDGGAADAPPQHARTAAEGAYGLLWDGGAGRLGPVEDTVALPARAPGEPSDGADARADARADEGADDAAAGRRAVVRPLTVTRGRAPDAGDPARLDVTLFATPAGVGVPYEEVLVPGPLGPLPAWWVPGDPARAVLVLHGRRRADRSEALRILPTLTGSGASVLVASYRNHDASPPSPDGLYHYGASEADDALAAVRWLSERGARRVALVGFSMGGSVAIGALTRWPEAVAGSGEPPEAAGLLLDSPLIDPFPVFARAARGMGLPAPGVLARWATTVAGWRAGVDFAALDRRRDAPSLDLPVALIAGTGDTTVPIETIDAFAEALPRPPAYLRLDGVEHVEGWNAERARYEAAVRAFLTAAGMDGDGAGAGAP